MNTGRRLEIYLKPITKNYTDGNGMYRVTSKQRRRLNKKAIKEITYKWEGEFK